MGKSFNFLILVMFVSTVLLYGQSDESKPYLSKTYPIQSIKSLIVQTSGGYINVSSTANSEAKVVVYLKNNNDKKTLTDEEFSTRLKDYEININLENGVLSCVSKRIGKDNWKNSLSVNIEVFVPSKINTNLKTSGGSISLSGLDGRQEFKTSGGSMSLENLSGVILGATSGGNITLNNAKGEIKLKTSGGSVKVENVKGNLDLSTSGGSFTLNNIKGDVNAVTSGGSIKINNLKGSLVTSTSGGSINLVGISGSVDASTSGGGISAEIKELGDYVKLSTSAGNVRLDLPFGAGMDLDLIGTRIKSDKLSKVTSDLSKGKVKGKVNGGGVEVKIRTSAGTIYLD